MTCAGVRPICLRGRSSARAIAGRMARSALAPDTVWLIVTLNVPAPRTQRLDVLAGLAAAGLAAQPSNRF